jgi:hypothetical protein
MSRELVALGNFMPGQTLPALRRAIAIILQELKKDWPMPDGWDWVRQSFEPPWKLKRHRTSGAYFIEDSNGRVLCWIYSRGSDAQNHKRPTEEEGLGIAKAIAKMSKRGPSQS